MNPIVASNKWFDIEYSSSLDRYIVKVKDEQAFGFAIKKDPLKLSIKKWKLIAETILALGIYIRDGGASTCALCASHNLLGEHACMGCPVYGQTGFKFCSATAYKKYADLWHDNYEDRNAISRDLAFKYATEEYLFLKGLRDADRIER